MKNIIIYGMRGAGKSTIGKDVSRRLGCEFIDLDKEIEKEVGCKLFEYIEKNGWRNFRYMEHNTLKKVLEIKCDKVVSLGGGTITFKKNRDEIKKLTNKKIIYIKTNIREITKRIIKDEKNNNKRNSLTGKGVEEELYEIYEQRKEIYENNCDMILKNNNDVLDVIDDLTIKLLYGQVCIPVVNFEEKALKKLCKKITPIKEIKFVELRIDFLDDIERLEGIIKKCPKEVIVTNRTHKEGGNFKGSIDESIKILNKASEYGAQFIDLELISGDKINDLELKDNTKLIISHHNFDLTPSINELKETVLEMQKYEPYIYKIALKPNNSEDINTMYELTSHFKKKHKDENFIFISMGELGLETRIKIPKLGGFLSFGSFGGDTSAPGQIDYKELYEKIYN